MINFSHAASAAIGASASIAVMFLAGAVPPVASTGTIDARRINIREPDGTLRMVLSGAADEPGIIVDGHEQPHPDRRSAGILFYNDEGTENGGLIFDGGRTKDGVAHSSGSLTFDRYKQDQVVQIEADQNGDDREAGLIVNDQPDKDMDFAAIDRARLLPAGQRAAAYRAANLGGTHRVFVGRSRDNMAQVVLKDAKGMMRLKLEVQPSGKAAIIFFDAKGHQQRVIG